MWVYTVQLNERKTAGEVQNDWEQNNPSPPSTGVSVAGDVAIITSNPRAANFQDFADNHAYADTIEEERELPNPGSNDWEPPYSVAGGRMEFLE